MTLILIKSLIPGLDLFQLCLRNIEIIVFHKLIVVVRGQGGVNRITGDTHLDLTAAVNFIAIDDDGRPLQDHLILSTGLEGHGMAHGVVFIEALRPLPGIACAHRHPDTGGFHLGGKAH